MKIVRTNEPFPTTCRPRQDGLEDYTVGEMHVGIYTNRGGGCWRVAVKHGDDKYIAEGKTAEELGDAVCAIMNEMVSRKFKPKMLPGGARKEIEG